MECGGEERDNGGCSSVGVQGVALLLMLSVGEDGDCEATSGEVAPSCIFNFFC